MSQHRRPVRYNWPFSDDHQPLVLCPQGAGPLDWCGTSTCPKHEPEAYASIKARHSIDTLDIVGDTFLPRHSSGVWKTGAAYPNADWSGKHAVMGLF